jgi:disulfide bond formation protein DsbB
MTGDGLKFAGAVLLGIVVTYSFAMGMVYFPVGLVVLLIAPIPGRRMKWAAIALWTVAATAVLGFYLAGYQTIAHPVPGPSGLAAVKAWLGFVLNDLGGPMSVKLGPADAANAGILYRYFHQHVAEAAGLAGLACFVGLPILLVRRRVEFRLLLPYVALGLYAIAAAALTGLGRIPYGSAWGAASRYTTAANLLWIADLAFLYIAFRSRLPRASAEPRADDDLPLRSLAALAFGIALGLLAWASLSEARAFRDFHDLYAPARAELVRLKDDSLLHRLNPAVDAIRDDFVPFLRKYRLSVFRKGAAEGK